MSTPKDKAAANIFELELKKYRDEIKEKTSKELASWFTWIVCKNLENCGRRFIWPNRGCGDRIKILEKVDNIDDYLELLKNHIISFELKLSQISESKELTVYVIDLVNMKDKSLTPYANEILVQLSQNRISKLSILTKTPGNKLNILDLVDSDAYYEFYSCFISKILSSNTTSLLEFNAKIPSKDLHKDLSCLLEKNKANKPQSTKPAGKKSEKRLIGPVPKIILSRVHQRTTVC